MYRRHWLPAGQSQPTGIRLWSAPGLALSFWGSCEDVGIQLTIAYLLWPTIDSRATGPRRGPCYRVRAADTRTWGARAEPGCFEAKTGGGAALQAPKECRRADERVQVKDPFPREQDSIARPVLPLGRDHGCGIVPWRCRIGGLQCLRNVPCRNHPGWYCRLPRAVRTWGGPTRVADAVRAMATGSTAEPAAAPPRPGVATFTNEPLITASNVLFQH